MELFKVGAKVKIIAIDKHPKFGEIGVIKKVDKASLVMPYLIEFKDKKTFWFCDREIVGD